MTRDSLPSNPCVLCCGDRFQLQPLVTIDNTTTVGRSVFAEEALRRRFVQLSITISQYRLNPEYSQFLHQFRTTRPSQQTVDQINRHGIFQEFPAAVTREVIQEHIRHSPNTLFLVLSRQTETFINNTCVEFFFHDQHPFPTRGEDLEPLVLYIGLPVIITQNRCKKTRYVNGITGTIAFFRDDTYFLRSDDQTIPIFPLFNEHQVMYYPLRSAYATTIHKIQGQTLDHVTLVFDMPSITPGMGYVALSRVASLDRVVPMLRLTRSHFSPVQ